MDNLLSGTECRTRNRALGHAVRCAAIMLLCVLSLCACDPYSGCRPYDYGDAKWALITTVNDLVAVVTYYGLAFLFLIEL